jgi:hypothetical protein
VPLPGQGAVSEELRDFIRLCMLKDPARRPTAEQLLQHPFITRVGDGGDGGGHGVRPWCAACLVGWAQLREARLRPCHD